MKTMTAQPPITHESAWTFAYIGQFRKRPALTRCQSLSEETKLHLLAREIVKFTPALADELVEDGRRALAAELA